MQEPQAGARAEIRDFYFGGLDQYRMSANSDHSQTLSPPKQTCDRMSVDFQRGELEWGAKGTSISTSSLQSYSARSEAAHAK